MKTWMVDNEVCAAGLVCLALVGFVVIELMELVSAELFHGPVITLSGRHLGCFF